MIDSPRFILICPEFEAGAKELEIAGVMGRLATDLAAHGGRCDLLWFSSPTAPGTVRALMQTLIPESCTIIDETGMNAPRLHIPEERARSYRLLHWFSQCAVSYDAILAPDYHGLGYYLAVAKEQGLALPEALLCIVAVASHHAERHATGVILSEYGELEVDFLEAQSVWRCDALLRASADVALWREPGMPDRRARDLDLAALPKASDPNSAGKFEAVWQMLTWPVAGRMQSDVTEGRAPLVSVCLVHRNRPNMVKQAVASLERQTYGNLEVILVDCASAMPAAIETLRALAPSFAARGWRLIYAEDRYLGAARNQGARLARGEYLLFMDDDNIAMDDEIAVFVAAAQRTGADILTGMTSVFSGAEPDHSAPPAHWIPLGADLSSGVFVNVFGDANALVRRQVFLDLGGFTEIHGVGQEDWEFFAKAVLAGYRLEIVPRPQFWYRHSAQSMTQSVGLMESHRRILTPYLAHCDPQLGLALNLALGGKLHDEELIGLLKAQHNALHADLSRLPIANRELEAALRTARAAIARAPLTSLVKRTALDIWRRIGTLFGPRSEDELMIAASPLFNADWYLGAYRPMFVNRRRAAAHYLLEGAERGFDPGPDFSTHAYRVANSDIADAGINPLAHYENFGRREGRALRRPPAFTL